MLARKKKVLFVYVHNSAHSVIAEAMLNQLCGDVYEAQSAGLKPDDTTVVNPLAVAVLKEDGIDVSGYKPRHVFEVVKSSQIFTHVIAMCDGASAEKCPIFPGVTQRLHWGFADPSTFEGTWKNGSNKRATSATRSKTRSHASSARSSAQSSKPTP